MGYFCLELEGEGYTGPGHISSEEPMHIQFIIIIAA